MAGGEDLTGAGADPGTDPGTDPVSQWEVARQRVRALVTGLDEEQVQRHVPACPDWTVRDLLSHVVGLPVDVLDGDEPEDHDPAWTQAHVDRRRGRSVAELVAEWDDVAPRLVAWMGEHGSRPLNDVVIHEQDLRGAVGEPGARDTPGLAEVRRRMAGRLADAVGDLPPIALVDPAPEGWRWCSHGDGGVDPDDAPVRLEASGFDLFRALTSRRTADQLRSWTVRGEITPYLDAFAGLGDLPTEPLPE